jgi:hypothetical protein
MSEDLKEDTKPKAGSAGPDRAGRHGLPAGTNPRSRFLNVLTIGRPCPQQGGNRQVSAADHPAKTAGLRRFRITACGPATGGNALGARGQDQDCEGSNPMSAAGTASLGQATWLASRATIASEPLERGEEARRRAMLAGAAIDRRSGASIDAKDRKSNRLGPAPTRPDTPASEDDNAEAGSPGCVATPGSAARPECAEGDANLKRGAGDGLSGQRHCGPPPASRPPADDGGSIRAGEIDSRCAEMR